MRKKFFEAWADTETINAKLGITVIALSVVVIILGAALLKIVRTPRPIYYIPGAERAGTAYPGRMPDECIGGFAEGFVLTLANFTPATISKVYQKIEKYLDPKLLSKTKAGLEEDIKRVKEDSMSSLFSADSFTNIEKRRNGYKVEVAGMKVIYMGRKKITEKRITYEVSLKKVSPTEVNPYGLLVVGISQRSGE